MKDSFPRQVLQLIRELTLYLAFCVGTFLMARSILQYVSLDPTVGFLAEKQDYLPIPAWRYSFYIHVFSSIFTLAAGASQFSPHVLSHWRGIHRWVGRLYVFDVLCVNAPVGLLMAVYANGFWPSKLAFVILDSLWFYFTLRAYLEIRRRNIAAHRSFMIRSYALTFSAVTLRMWKLILGSFLNLEPITLYMIDAWLGFVPNLIIAEVLVRRLKNSQAYGSDSSSIGQICQ